MSVEMACTCGDLPAHSHVFAHEEREAPILTYGIDGQTHTMAQKTFVAVDTGEVRIWVDWKAVARELSASSGGNR